MQLDPGKGGCSSARGEHARDNDPTRRGHACCGSPGREEGRGTLSRVGFIGAGLTAAAGALGGYTSQAAASASVQVWGLDPNWDGGDPASCGCGACSACRSHAANKWFSSAAAADAGRAHAFCKCAVVPLLQVDRGMYDALFADGGNRASVDLRHQWVQAVLAQSRNAPGQVAAGPAGRVQVVVRPAPVRGVNGRRALFVEIHTREAVTATITITREGNVLLRKSVKGVRGVRRLRLDIPMHVRGGPARLRLTLRTSSGRTKVITRGIQIPRMAVDVR